MYVCVGGVWGVCGGGGGWTDARDQQVRGPAQERGVGGAAPPTLIHMHTPTCSSPGPSATTQRCRWLQALKCSSCRPLMPAPSAHVLHGGGRGGGMLVFGCLPAHARIAEWGGRGRARVDARPARTHGGRRQRTACTAWRTWAQDQAVCHAVHGAHEDARLPPHAALHGWVRGGAGGGRAWVCICTPQRTRTYAQHACAAVVRTGTTTAAPLRRSRKVPNTIGLPQQCAFGWVRGVGGVEEW